MYLIDGVQVEKEDFILPVENIGVWRGDGIFEAIRIHEGYPFGIDLHIESCLLYTSPSPRDPE